MALTEADYLFWKGLRDADLIPHRPCLLEIGEANWYGDLAPAVLAPDIDRYALLSERAELHAKLEAALVPENRWGLFDVADVFWRTFLHCPARVAIDLHGTPNAIPHDLNRVWPDCRPFRVVVNSGTAEHVFDQRRIWETVHDATEVGGLVVHALPLWGWLDHGFYNYHPTFVADLAAANGYDVVRWAFVQMTPFAFVLVSGPEDFGRLAKTFDARRSAMQYVAFAKREDRPFRVPMQGYYAGTLTEKRAKAWREER